MLAHDIRELSKTDVGKNFLIHIAAPLAHHGLLMKNENLPSKEVDAANKIREVSHAFLSALVELLNQSPGIETATLVNELGSPTQRKPQLD